MCVNILIVGRELQWKTCISFVFHPQAIETCVAAAGFSVGEFAALVFAGSMNFAEGKHEVTRFAASIQ